MQYEFYNVMSLSFRRRFPGSAGGPCPSHGSCSGAAADGRTGSGGHAGAAEGKAGDWHWTRSLRGPREEDGTSGRGAAEAHAAGTSAQFASHGVPHAHEPAHGSDTERSVITAGNRTTVRQRTACTSMSRSVIKTTASSCISSAGLCTLNEEVFKGVLLNKYNAWRSKVVRVSTNNEHPRRSYGVNQRFLLSIITLNQFKEMRVFFCTSNLQ